MRVLLVAVLLSLVALHGLADSFVRFEEKGKVGLKDAQGKVLIPAAFDALGWSDGNFSVIGQVTGYKLKDHWGLINLQKQFITHANYETLTYSGGDRVIASLKTNPFSVKFGCIDFAGKVTIPFHYDAITVSGLRAIVMSRNGPKYEYGLVDLDDKGFIPVRYRQIRSIGTLRYAVENDDHKMALFSEQGLRLTEFEIDSVSAFHNGLAVVYQNFGQGLLDRDGSLKIRPRYRELRINGDASVSGREFSEWKILDAQNHELKKINADKLEKDRDGYFKISLAARSGIVNNNLEVVIPMEYQFIGPDDHGHRVVKNNGRFGVLREDRSLLLPTTFDSLVLENNFIRVRQGMRDNAHWSVYDTFGIEKTSARFEFLGRFNGRFFPARKRGYWGGVNRYGEESIRCVFDSLLETRGDVIAVKFRGQYGIIDTNERWLLTPQHFRVRLINENCYLENRDTVTFLKKMNGEVVFFSEKPLIVFDSVLEEVSANGTARTIGFDGLESGRSEAPITMEGVQRVFPSSEGFRTILKDGKYGFVDMRGRLRIANRYDNAGNFHEGLAPIKLIGKWGYVDAQDHIAIHPNYETVGDFHMGLSIVRRAGKWGLLDKEGKVVLAIRYDSLVRLPDETFLLKNGSLSGLANAKGTVIVEPRFDVINNPGNGFVIVGRDGRYGVINLQGLSTVPMIYDALIPDTNGKYLALVRPEWRTIHLE